MTDHVRTANGTSTTVVIFGASGDLTKRKLLPALYNLHVKGRLAEPIRIVGYARRPLTDDDFRARALEGIREHTSATHSADTWAKFAGLLHYQQGDLALLEDFETLSGRIAELEGDVSSVNRLYYLATAPRYYSPVIGNLGASGLAEQTNGRRDVVIEKPFGHDQASARTLNQAVHEHFDESQVYRIDHYLGKETAQNILFFRFANSIFEPVWNRRYIDSVQITVAEAVDVGHRAGYYDTAGVVRDMFQNHMLQLLALTAMEPPASFEADRVRNEKVKVLSAIRPLLLDETVLAQYESYCESDGVADGSRTPTYAAMKLHIDNWRWQGVPFYLRSGKALQRKVSEIIVRFQRPPHMMFDLPDDYRFTANTLALCIQPDEGIHLRFETKVPDSLQETRSVDMEFHYRDSFTDRPIPDAYERLVFDALKGDASLFARSDGIDVSWQLVDPVASGWEQLGDTAIPMYRPGTEGPDESELLLERDGRWWHSGCGAHAGKTVEGAE